VVEPPFIQVSAGLIVRDGRYLITKRKTGVHLEGLWEFPGGKREAGESLEQCLVRELHEELDVEITAPVPFRIVRHRYPEKEVELHFFLCSIRKGEPRAIGCEDFRWIAPEDFTRFAFPVADASVLEALRDLPH
jgi:mutator protein MutT